MQRRAFLVYEAIAGVLLTIIVLVAFGALVVQFANLHDYVTTLRRARSAAEYALNCAAAGVDDPLTAAADAGVTAFEDVRVQLARDPGQGEWRGATLVTATASAATRTGRPVRVRLSVYVFTPEQPP